MKGPGPFFYHSIEYETVNKLKLKDFLLTLTEFHY